MSNHIVSDHNTLAMKNFAASQTKINKYLLEELEKAGFKGENIERIKFFIEKQENITWQTSV